MRGFLTLIAVLLIGLFGATSIGYAAYLVSKDSVGLPVTKLELAPNKLAPTPAAPRKRSRPRPPAPLPPPPPSGVTTTDDHSGRSGSGDSHGGKDD
jgi:hypothetical protein